MPKAKYNSKGEVKVRFVLKDVKNREWDEFYSHHNGYHLVKDLQSGDGKSYGKRFVFSVPLLEGWEELRKLDNNGFDCPVCSDTGIFPGGGFCSCELGLTAKRHFAPPSEVHANEENSQMADTSGDSD